MKKIQLLCLLMVLIIIVKGQIPTNGLVAYYPFNGNANDESGNGNNGTVKGATLTTDRFGNANKAYYFDGIKNIIELNKNMCNSASFSISVWYMSDTNDLPRTKCLIGRRAGFSDTTNLLEFYSGPGLQVGSFGCIHIHGGNSLLALEV